MDRSAPQELADALRAEGCSERVLAAMEAAPRELFVPADSRERAYANVPLPIGGGQTISQPLVVARMLDLLGLEGRERILDVGTGSGWHAALLAILNGSGGSVISIERDRELSHTAALSLAAAGIEGVRLEVGDGFAGFPEGAPYDAINVAAAAPEEAIATLESQLAEGGRLIAPLEGFAQRLILSRNRRGRFTRRRLEHVRFVPLVRGLA